MSSLSINQILNLVRSGQISPDEGFKRLKEYDGSGLTDDGKCGSQTIMYLNETWEESGETDELQDIPEKILLFADSGNIEAALKEQVGQVIFVQPGKSYATPESGVYAINPGNRQDYFTLIQTLIEEDALPDRIIHMWSMEGFSVEGECLKTGLDRGFYSVFYLSQALMQLKSKSKVRLLYAYTSEKGGIQPLNGAMDGFVRTIRQENPLFVYKTLELTEVRDGLLTPVLLKELDESTEQDIEVRYEGRRRFVKRLKGFETDRCACSPQSIREGGVYLITGGTGGLGLIFAEYLAKNYKACIALSGRSDLNTQKEGEIARLKSYGADVIYVKADVSEPGEANRLIGNVKDRFGRIDGILHCAGLTDDCLVANKNPEAIREVLAPKVFGTIALDEAVCNEALDFFVLFSSASSVLGNRGQGDYAFANSFMNRFAMVHEHKRKKGERSGRAVAISWPLWEAGGMQIKPHERQMLETLYGIVPLSTENGIRIFEKILALDMCRFIVLQGDEEKLQRSFNTVQGKVPALQEETIPEAGNGPGEKDLLEKLRQELIQQVSKLLKIHEKEINPEDDMQEYGFDSVTQTQLINEINEIFGLECSPALFYELEKPTLRSLSEYLYENHKRAIGRHYSVSEKKANPVKEDKKAPNSRFMQPAGKQG